MRQTAPTPKVFNAKYTPPKSTNNNTKNVRRPLLLVAAIITSGLLITRLPVFKIKSVELSGTTSESVNKLTQSLLGESIFSNKISLISHQILTENSDIAVFSCSRGIPATLRCSATIREAIFVWKSNNSNYMLDSSGYVFAEAKEVVLPVIEDRANKPTTIGDNVTSEDIVTSYSKLIEKLRSSGIVTSQFYITESFYQFGVIISGRSSPELPFPATPINVIFITSYSLDAQVKVLAQLLSERSAQIKERIDLRVPENVYYY